MCVCVCVCVWKCIVEYVIVLCHTDWRLLCPSASSSHFPCRCNHILGMWSFIFKSVCPKFHFVFDVELPFTFSCSFTCVSVRNTDPCLLSGEMISWYLILSQWSMFLCSVTINGLFSCFNVHGSCHKGKQGKREHNQLWVCFALFGPGGFL